jgi:hypothetical protein
MVQSGLLKIFDIDNCLLKRMDFRLSQMQFEYIATHIGNIPRFNKRDPALGGRV